MQSAGKRVINQLTKCFEIGTNEISRLRAELSSVSAKTKTVQTELVECKKSLQVVSNQCATHTKEIANLECLRDKTLASLKEQQQHAEDTQLRIKHLTMKVASTSTCKLRFKEVESHRALLASQLGAMREGIRSLLRSERVASTTPPSTTSPSTTPPSTTPPSTKSPSTTPPSDTEGQRDCQEMGDGVPATVNPSRHDDKMAAILGMGFELPRPVLIALLDSVNGDLQSALSKILDRVPIQSQWFAIKLRNGMGLAVGKRQAEAIMRLHPDYERAGPTDEESAKRMAQHWTSQYWTKVQMQRRPPYSMHELESQSVLMLTRKAEPDRESIDEAHDRINAAFAAEAQLEEIKRARQAQLEGAWQAQLEEIKRVEQKKRAWQARLDRIAIDGSVNPTRVRSVERGDVSDDDGCDWDDSLRRFRMDSVLKRKAKSGRESVDVLSARQLSREAHDRIHAAWAAELEEKKRARYQAQLEEKKRAWQAQLDRIAIDGSGKSCAKSPR